MLLPIRRHFRLDEMRGKAQVLADCLERLRPDDATVSMPVSWKSLATLYSTDFTIKAVPDIVAAHGDAWEGFLDAKGDPRGALRAAS